MITSTLVTLQAQILLYSTHIAVIHVSYSSFFPVNDLEKLTFMAAFLCMNLKIAGV